MCATFWRQLYLCSGLWTMYFIFGLRAGFSTVLVPQLRKENQTITIEQFSWLPTINIYSGIPWVIIVSFLVDVIGRKKPYIIVCVCTLLCYIFLYFSSNMTHFLLAEFFGGPLASTHFSLLPIIFNEYISPENRSIFLPLKGATFAWGVLVANAIGTYFHWRNIIILGLVCSVYSLVNVSVWPESPLWLAKKGKFDDCVAAHRWLKGENQESEKELVYLQEKYNNNRFSKKRWTLGKLFEILSKKQFYKPILLANILLCLSCFSGKLICTVYALDILKQTTGSEHESYKGMLILDGVTVVSMYLGCILSKYVKRRVFLISLSVLAIACMLSISLFLYLVKTSVIENNTYVSLVLLAIYSIATSCGPQMMSVSIIVELIPLKSRIVTVCVSAISLKLINGTNMKLTPWYFKMLDLHGTFAMFAVMSATFLILVYFFIPETKDKTIQQIDESLNRKQNKKNNSGPNIKRSTSCNEIPLILETQ